MSQANDDGENLEISSELSPFDTEITLLYKKGYDLGIPVKYLFYDTDGNIVSLLDFIDQKIGQNLTLPEIYNEILNITDTINASDIAMTYFNRQLGGETEPKPEKVKELLSEINSFYTQLNDSLSENKLSLDRIPILKDIDELDTRYEQWTNNFNSSLLRDYKVLNTILGIQDRLEQIKPLNSTPFIIQKVNMRYKPLWTEEFIRKTRGKKIISTNKSRKIETEDGIEIFNEAIPSLEIPFIQYNDSEGKQYYRIYTGGDEDERMIDFNTLIRNPYSNIEKRNTIYLKVWTGKESPKKLSRELFEDVKYNLDDGTLTISVPLEGRNLTEAVNSMVQRVTQALPVIDLGPGEETRIKGFFDIEDVVISEASLADRVLNQPLYNTYFYIEEHDKSRAEKTRLDLHYKSFTGKEDIEETDEYRHRSSVNITFGIPEEENEGKKKNLLRVNVLRAESRTILNQFLEVFKRIMSDYMKEKAYEDSIFREYIPGSSSVKGGTRKESIKIEGEEEEEEEEEGGKKTGASDSKIRSLQKKANDVFVSGYARFCQCSNQPIIVDPNEVEDWMNYPINERGEKRQLMVFPPPLPGQEPEFSGPDGPNWIFVCPTNEYPYPYVKSSSLENSDRYPYLPCCGEKDKLSNPKSGYYKYYQMKTKKSTTTARYQIVTSKVLAVNQEAPLPNQLNEFLKEGLDREDYIFVRRGVASDLNSFLHCVVTALRKVKYLNLGDNEAAKEAYIRRKREKIARSPKVASLVYSQELFDLSQDEIQAQVGDNNLFYDPYLFYRGVEEYYKVNIFVFNLTEPLHPPITPDGEKLEGPVIEIPRHKLLYIRHNRPDRPTIIILKHMGSESDALKYPRCELVLATRPAKKEEEGVKKRGRRRAEITAGNGPIYTFGAQMENLLYSATLEFSKAFVWSFPTRSATELADGRQTFKDLQTRVNPYSQINWYAILSSYKIVGQRVDGYGKARLVAVQLTDKEIMSMMIPPSQPFNAPYLTLITYVSEALPLQLLGKPVTRAEGGLWYSVADLYWGVFIPTREAISQQTETFAVARKGGAVGAGFQLPGRGQPPDAPKGVIVPPPIFFNEIKSVITPEERTNPILVLRTTKRWAMILVQLINWSWRMSYHRDGSFDPLPEWWSQWVIKDKKIKAGAYPPGPGLNRKLPEVKNTKDAIRSLITWWPEYFRDDGKIHLNPTLYDKLLGFFLEQEKITDGLTVYDPRVAPQKYLNDLYVFESDFIPRPSSLVIVGVNNLRSWLRYQLTRHLYQTPIFNRVNLAFALRMEPYLYVDAENNFYLVQNVRDGDKKRALYVYYSWLNYGVNPGFNVSFPTEIDYDELPKVIYGISVAQTIVPIADETKGETPYYQILEYVKDGEESKFQKYGALLPLNLTY